MGLGRITLAGIVLIGTFGLTGCESATTPLPEGAIVGRVLWDPNPSHSSEYIPSPGACVSISGSISGATYGCVEGEYGDLYAKTDEEGEFLMQGIPEGPYILVATNSIEGTIGGPDHPAFRSGGKLVEVRGGERTDAGTVHVHALGNVVFGKSNH